MTGLYMVQRVDWYLCSVCSNKWNLQKAFVLGYLSWLLSWLLSRSCHSEACVISSACVDCDLKTFESPFLILIVEVFDCTVSTT